MPATGKRARKKLLGVQRHTAEMYVLRKIWRAHMYQPSSLEKLNHMFGTKEGAQVWLNLAI